MKAPRLHIARFVTFIVALQILSIGLFVQDFEPLITSVVTPEINIINTIDEFIAEVLFAHKDAVPENVNHSKKDIQIHKHFVVKLVNLAKPSLVWFALGAPSPNLAGFLNKYNYQFFEEITPPPPKIKFTFFS